MRPRVTIVVILMALTASNTADPLVFNSSDALYSAMDAGVFNSSSPLILTLLPGRYLLPRAIVIMSPEVTLMGGGVDYGSWTELECTTTSSNGVALFLFSRAVQASNINLTSCINTALIASPLPGGNIINLTLSRSSFLSNPGQGLSLTGSLGYVSMIGCVFDGNGKRLQGMMNQASSAAAFIGISSISVLNSSFLNNQGPTTLLISSMSPSSSSLISHSMFINNSVSGNGGAITLLSAGNFSIGPGCLFQSNAANVTGSHGGAISSLGTTLYISSTDFIQNSAGESGGAIFASQAQSSNKPLTIAVSNSSFRLQTAAQSMNLPEGGGGAIYLSNINSLWVSSSIFENNNVMFGCGFSLEGLGGAIFSNGPSVIRLSNSIFNNNQACYGGAVLANKASSSALLSLWIIDSVLDGNLGQETGGAVQSALADKIILQGSRFSNNTSSRGGAVWSTLTASLIIVDTFFYSNMAQMLGGAIFSSPYSTQNLVSTVNITQSVFRNNVAMNGQGGAVGLQGPLIANFSLCSFEGNQAAGSNGGAVAISGPLSLSLASSLFQWNDARTYGGSVYGTQMTLQATNSTFVSGQDAAAQGTAVFAVSSPPPVSDSLICVQGGSQPSWVSCSSLIVPHPPYPSPPVTPSTSSSDSSMALAIGLGVGLPCGIIALSLLIFFMRKIWTRLLRMGLNNNYLQKSGYTLSYQPSFLPPPPPPEIQMSQIDISVNGAAAALMADPSPLQEVRQVADMLSGGNHVLDDKLILLETIGQGGSGTVYKGRWRNLDVAVKTIIVSNQMPQPENSRVVYTRAVNEAGICCSLLHPNVITTYAHDMKAVDIKGCQGSCSPMNAAEWKLFLVQELCDGSLMDLLENDAFTLLESDLPNYEVLTNSLIEVAQGCEYIHSKGIIHGDLKLENVLAKLNNTSPNGFRVKISDFGLAALIGVDQTHISNFRHGTPFYMAPEIISSGEATKSSDVFSFAVMSIELCTGRPPWVRNGKGQFEPNKDFLNLPSHTPDGFRDLWTDCLQNDPKGRPTFAEIVVRLISMQIAEISQADLESDAGLCCLDVEGEGSTHFS